MKTKFLGVGVGLRRQHFDSAKENPARTDWFEIISENFMAFGGRPRAILNQIKKEVPCIPHGLGLSLGSSGSLDKQYLRDLKRLFEDVNPLWFSDHLCLSQSPRGIHYHDLIPTIRSKESLKVICDKIKRLEDYIQRPFAFENISAYFEPPPSQFSETDFINEILNHTNAFLLLDINNVYVNSINFSFDPYKYLSQIPSERVLQIHLAGHERGENITIDTHGGEVDKKVWELFEWYQRKSHQPISTLIEWDNNLPSYEVLCQEADNAREIINQIFEINYEATRV